MRTKLIVASFFIASFNYAYGQSQSWSSWRAEFEQLAKSKGLLAVECTPYQVGGQQQPHRLLEFYRSGLSPKRAFEEIGCDVEVFEQVYMKEVRRIVGSKAYIPHTGDDEDNADAANEYLWLNFFLENRPPSEAATAVRQWLDERKNGSYTPNGEHR